MIERLHKVELTTNFLARLESIDGFLGEAGAAVAFDKLLAELRSVVIPNLSRFPHMGRRYLDEPPRSTEALSQISLLPAGAASALCEYLHGDYLLLYTVIDQVVYLLSIRHRRQLSFDFARLWPK